MLALRRTALVLLVTGRGSSFSSTPFQPLVNVLPPKVRAEGVRGLVGYSAVELAWWGAPAAFTWTAAAGDPALFFDAGKGPFLAAVLLWPNSWFRNGCAIRVARTLRGD